MRERPRYLLLSDIPWVINLDYWKITCCILIVNLILQCLYFLIAADKIYVEIMENIAETWPRNSTITLVHKLKYYFMISRKTNMLFIRIEYRKPIYLMDNLSIIFVKFLVKILNCSMMKFVYQISNFDWVYIKTT